MNGLERRNEWVGNTERSRRTRRGLMALATAVGAILGTVLGMGGRAEAQTPSFNFVGIAPGGNRSHITALSADGRVATGYTEYPIGTNRETSFTWSQAGGRTDFGLLPGFTVNNRPSGISADGSVVVGVTTNPGPQSIAYRYTTAGGFQSLPAPTGFTNPSAAGISGDGGVLVGAAQGPVGFGRAVRWTGSVPQVIPAPDAGVVGWGFNGVSRDGSTYIGGAGPSLQNTNEAYKWTEGGGWTLLVPPSGFASPYNCATGGASTDGSVVVGGIAPITGPQVALVWRGSQATALAPPVAGWDAGAGSINDAGTIIAGMSGPRTSSAYVATLWTEVGPTLLSDYLLARGVQIPQGWSLTGCTVSADGLHFAGDARGPDFLTVAGFVATVPSPPAFSLALGAMALMAHRRRLR